MEDAKKLLGIAAIGGIAYLAYRMIKAKEAPGVPELGGAKLECPFTQMCTDTVNVCTLHVEPARPGTLTVYLYAEHADGALDLVYMKMWNITELRPVEDTIGLVAQEDWKALILQLCIDQYCSEPKRYEVVPVRCEGQPQPQPQPTPTPAPSPPEEAPPPSQPTPTPAPQPKPPEEKPIEIQIVSFEPVVREIGKVYEVYDGARVEVRVVVRRYMEAGILKVHIVDPCNDRNLAIDTLTPYGPFEQTFSGFTVHTCFVECGQIARWRVIAELYDNKLNKIAEATYEYEEVACGGP